MIIIDDVQISGRGKFFSKVTIGRRLILATGTVVTKDISPFSAGRSVRMIKSRL